MSEPLAVLVQQAQIVQDWYDTTHAERLGHDHHCPVIGDGNLDERCTCGWSKASLALDHGLSAAIVGVAAIPPDAVLVTEESLAAAMHATSGIVTSGWGYTQAEHLARCRELAPRVLAALRARQ